MSTLGYADQPPRGGTDSAFEGKRHSAVAIANRHVSTNRSAMTANSVARLDVVTITSEIGTNLPFAALHKFVSYRA